MSVQMGEWIVDDVKSTRKIPQEMDDGTTEFVRVRIDSVTLRYQCLDASEDEIRIVRTRHGYNLTWPDGHSEGSRPMAQFYRWLAARFGEELTLAVAREMEGV